jgi:hypothetical protein
LIISLGAALSVRASTHAALGNFDDARRCLDEAMNTFSYRDGNLASLPAKENPSTTGGRVVLIRIGVRGVLVGGTLQGRRYADRSLGFVEEL